MDVNGNPFSQNQSLPLLRHKHSDPDTQPDNQERYEHQSAEAA